MPTKPKYFRSRSYIKPWLNYKNKTVAVQLNTHEVFVINLNVY